MGQKVELSKEEIKFYNHVVKCKAAEIKEEPEYANNYPGYPIPTDHPRNDLTPQLKKVFGKELELAKILVKKKVLKVMQDSSDMYAVDVTE